MYRIATQSAHPLQKKKEEKKTRNKIESEKRNENKYNTNAFPNINTYAMHILHYRIAKRANTNKFEIKCSH